MALWHCSRKWTVCKGKGCSIFPVQVLSTRAHSATLDVSAHEPVRWHSKEELITS